MKEIKPKPKPDKNRISVILEGYFDGVSQQSIADFYKVSKQVINRIIIRNTTPAQRKRVRAENAKRKTKERIEAYLKSLKHKK